MIMFFTGTFTLRARTPGTGTVLCFFSLRNRNLSRVFNQLVVYAVIIMIIGAEGNPYSVGPLGQLRDMVPGAQNSGDFLVVYI